MGAKTWQTLVWISLLTWACTGDKDGEEDTATPLSDEDEGDADDLSDIDGDGYTTSDGDCNDGDAAVHPDADEACNGVDDNCDGEVDEGVTTTWYQDADGDGYGNPNASVDACEAPDQMVDNASDCDDLDASVSPDGIELCNEADDDCDGDIDEDATDGGPWYHDADSDEYGDPDSYETTCEQPSGTVTDDSDCDDDDDQVFPGSTATETPGDGIDTDCDGADVCDDLDCDGQADLLVVGYNDDDGSYGDANILLYYGTDFADADATEFEGLSGWSAGARDLNQDGYVDLVIGNHTDGSSRYVDSYVYWGSASGYSDSDRTDIESVGAAEVLIEDLDGDGYLDLAFANASTGGNSGFNIDSYIYWGSSSGYSESDRTDLPTSGGWALGADDLDGDGLTDLVVCNYYDEDGSRYYEVESLIYWGDSSRFTTETTTGLPTAGCRDVHVEDLDGDGQSDLVFANSYDNTGSWQIDSTIFWNDGARFDDPDTTGLPTSWTYGMTAADVDGDGDTDLLFASLWGDDGYEAESYVYWNEGGTFDEADHCALPTMGAYTIYAADLDDDGVSEVLVPSSWDDDDANETWSHIFWTVTPEHCECGETLLPTLAPLEMSIGDLDNDGYMDLAYASSSYVSYDTETLIYWGSADGYDENAVTGIATDHGVSSAPLMIGL